MPHISAQATPVAPAAVHSDGRWAGYAAGACAFLNAAVSFYWAAGGTFGLDTVGSQADELAALGNVGAFIVWFAGLLKVAGGLLALALVQAWGPRLFRPGMLLLAGWGGAAVLVLYGGAQVGSLLLVATGVVEASDDMDWRAFYGHLYLWDLWFLVWGVLLAITAFYYTRNRRRLGGS